MIGVAKRRLKLEFIRPSGGITGVLNKERKRCEDKVTMEYIEKSSQLQKGSSMGHSGRVCKVKKRLIGGFPLISANF